MIRFAAALLALAVALPAAAEETWSKLLSPQDLAALAEAGPLTILDIRAPEGDGPSYAAGHVPGAVNAPYATWRGPAENPGQPLTEAALTERLQSAGIAFETPVAIVYQGETQSDFGAAARVYWTLKTAGHERLAILNGGFKAWQEAGLPVSTEPTQPVRTAVTARVSDRWTATVEEIEAASSGSGGAVLVDARPEAFFKGETKHDAAPEAGTIARAVNLVHASWFGPEETVISAPEAAVARAQALAAEAGDAPLVSFCNTGHWAATNWFALSEIAGVEDVKLYPESMVGWTSRGLPTVAGEPLAAN